MTKAKTTNHTIAIQHRALTLANELEAVIAEAKRLQGMARRIASGESRECPGSASDLITIASRSAGSCNRLDALVMAEFDESDEGAGDIAAYTARTLAKLQAEAS
jgi:hypothetical protein